MLAGALLAALPRAAAAQHAEHRMGPDPAARRWSAGGHAVPTLTRATPTAGRQSRTEGYLSQVALMAMASSGGGWLEAMGMLNLEGLTMPGGELTTGAIGEGYVDRRHPHAYLYRIL